MLFSLLTGTLISQNQKPLISVKDSVFGKLLAHDLELKGKIYGFGSQIRDLTVDPSQRYFIIQLRDLSKNGKWLKNKGRILVFDSFANEVKWVRPIKYPFNQLSKFGDVLILKQGAKSARLSITEGHEMPLGKKEVYWVDNEFNIGLFYKVRDVFTLSNKLQAINLDNGKILWERKLENKFGWEKVFYESDSTLYIHGAGLQKLDVFTGKGWDYNEQTGKETYITNLYVFFNSYVGSARPYLKPPNVQSVIHNVNSNLVEDSLNFYMATKNALSCINKSSGDIVWTKAIPPDVGSESLLLKKDSILYLLNFGNANVFSIRVHFGKPFLAAYNMESGNLIYSKVLDHERTTTVIKRGKEKEKTKKTSILSFFIDSTSVNCVFPEKIARYSLKDASLLKENHTLSDSIGEMRFIVGSQNYLKDSFDLLKPIFEVINGSMVVLSKNAKFLVLNDSLEITDTISSKRNFIRIGDYESLNLFYGNERTYIANADGKIVGELSFSSNAFIIEGMLYDIIGDKLYALDLRKYFGYESIAYFEENHFEGDEP